MIGSELDSTPPQAWLRKSLERQPLIALNLASLRDYFLKINFLESN